MTSYCLPRVSWIYSIIPYIFQLTARLGCFLAQTEEPWEAKFSLWKLYLVSKQSVLIVILMDIK